MDLGRSISYPFNDEHWIVKTIIGAFVLLIPIVNFIAYGYYIRVIRNVMNGVEDKMPEWDDWGNDFVKGLLGFVAYFVYFLPVIVLYCCFIAITIAISPDSSTTTTTTDTASGAEAVIVILSVCVVIFVIAYAIAITPVFLAGVIRYVQTDAFSASFFSFGERLQDVTSHLSETLLFIVLAIVLQFGVGLIAGLTIWLCGIGLLVNWGGQVMTAHLLAQYGNLLDNGRAEQVA